MISVSIYRHFTKFPLAVGCSRTSLEAPIRKRQRGPSEPGANARGTILIGLPDLKERLTMHRNRSYASRITYRA
jgi:hypothetical protein